MNTRHLRTSRLVMTAGLVCALSLGVYRARADLEVSASVQIHANADFYAPLSEHGGWIEISSYGRCWRPTGVAVGWRPYCAGHWVWTDCGWYWSSDEPWAWACYHYGWWAYEPMYGWVWVPGVEWAPAWVSWRVGGGYVGWAPLPPHGARLAGPQFVFVQEARFSEPIRPSVVVNNTTIFNKTTVVNNVKRETRTFDGGARQRVVVNEGPGAAGIEKATGRRVEAVPIQQVARQSAAPARMYSSPHTGHSEAPHGEPFARPPGPQGKPLPPSEGKPHGHEQKSEGNDHGKDHS